MKKVFVVAAGLMLMSLPAWSQSSNESDDRGSSYGRRDDLEELLRGLDEGRSGAGLRRGAGFLLRSGDATLAVRCDPRENMRACVEASTLLLERARSVLSPGGGPGAPSGTTPPR
jgi:hypothetical protein